MAMSSYAAPLDELDSFIDFTGGIDANYAPEEASTPLSGPSHDYNTFPQQTGFPSGSMSSVVGYADVNMDSNDFTSQPDFASGLNADMDLEKTPRQASAFFPHDDFVDPTAVYEPQPQPVRMWPGMHSQQAAEQAKAAALAKKSQTAAHSSSSSSSTSSSFAGAKGKQRTSSHAVPLDPAADRKISDILNSMRHKSIVSTIDEEDDDLHGSRGKRDDDDLDDDERLLASEEGKKLSSKERRQLRNKVSARAFRSRRKEYISQLEGDLAGKTSEANDLRVLNRKLLEENNQLKNLTRTVLGHPAFHTFLDDMSRNPTFVPPPAEMIARVPTQQANNVMSAPQTDIKMEQDQHSLVFHPQPEDLQVNMVQLPQTDLDVSMLNLGNNHWGQQHSSNVNFHQPRVYAVFDVPRGPPAEELSRSARLARSQSSAADTLAPSSSLLSTNDLSCLPSPAVLQSYHDATSSSVGSIEPRSVDECLALIDHLYATLDHPGSRRKAVEIR